ncbi:MAG TPA: copper resistance CopC family protein [Methylomirabilota bacterium]|nr:copper resistance CopC family protein [Methylomirabilota bacterium]
MTSLWLALIVGALLLSRGPAASAHSLLLDSSPAAGAVVARPGRVSLRFNNRIEKRLSRIRLVDPRGEARVLATLPGGPPERLEAVAPALGPGAYRLEWSVLSTDGHLVSGAFPFRIRP